MSEKTRELMKLMRKQKFGGRGMRRAPMAGNHARGPVRLLRLISKNEGLTNAEIAEKLDIRPSSVSVGLSHLEEAGFIERRAKESDKRVSTIHLTAKGQEMLNQAKARRDEMSEKMFGNLTEEEQDQLIKLLNKVQENFDTLDFEDMRHEMPGFGPRGPFFGR